MSNTDKLRDPFYAVATMHTETELDGGDSFSISKRDFNKYIEYLEKLIEDYGREERIAELQDISLADAAYQIEQRLQELQSQRKEKK